MATASNSTQRVTLTPKPGFVIKTTSTLNGTYITSLGNPAISSSTSGPVSQTVPETIAVHKGYKIFLNICWDPQVPPPPERNEDEIRKAMMGADLDDGMYFIPVVVGDGKTTVDKEIATPNIASKGVLEPRTVSIPTAVPAPKPLIQEIPSFDAAASAPTIPPKGILKPSSRNETPPAALASATQRETPKWSAEVDNSGVIVVLITPKLVRSRYPMFPGHAKTYLRFLTGVKTRTSFQSPQTTPILDIEPHRIIFILPNVYELDLRLNSAAGKLSAVKGKLDENAIAGSSVGGGRGLDPDGAIAEWRVDK
ncbi:hypothetical protein FRC01_011560, partial [Tulasnella sp. 417]